MTDRTEQQVQWTKRRDEKKRIAAVEPWMTGPLLPTERALEALELLVKPGDRIVLEGDNQKQADFLSRTLVKVDPKKVHGLHLVTSMVRRTLSTALHSRQLASLAEDALIAEAELTPKPGLVDRRGSGAHNDLSLEIMRRSAKAIEPFFAKMAAAAADSPTDSSLRAVLGAIGRAAETAMFKATNGSNSHKGAIWILGLMVAGASSQVGVPPTQVAYRASQLARLPDHPRIQLVSHGDVVRARYGAAGARGEACAGFPHVIHVGLPALAAARAYGLPEEVSRLHALLHIMATLDDTCVLYRSGAEGLQLVKQGARWVLNAGGPGCASGEEAFSRLDRELSLRRISPGGSADLLAATLFLDALHEGRRVQEDDCLQKGRIWNTLSSNIQMLNAALPRGLMSA